MPDLEALEMVACQPATIEPMAYNPASILPYGLTTEHLRLVMSDFLDFLGFFNLQLHTKGLKRLETMMMQANFSSIASEYMKGNLPHYCKTVVTNRHHNGHPDLLPVGIYSGGDVEHGVEGIEIKASRRASGWQGHNPEDCWLMVFVYSSNTPDESELPRPFRFLSVVGARLTQADWSFSGRGERSRRTITASVIKSGYEKMLANWIYRSAVVDNQAGVAPQDDE